MVDVCRDESLKPGLRIDQFIESDLRSFFACTRKVELATSVPTQWVDFCDELKHRFTPFEGAERAKDSERVVSYRFWEVFRTYEEDNSILALGNNTANTAKLQIGVKKPNQRVLTNYTCGSMGYDLPAAIGASVASGRKVYCITGDGSIMMNLQELQTIVGYDLPISIVVFSNDGYNAIRQTSINFFNGEIIGCTPDTGVTFPSFEAIAKTFGFSYRHCRRNGELNKELKFLTESKERVFLEIDQILDDPVIPKVMSRLDSEGKMMTPALHDMYPFISEEELNRYMINE